MTDFRKLVPFGDTGRSKYRQLMDIEPTLSSRLERLGLIALGAFHPAPANW